MKKLSTLLLLIVSFLGHSTFAQTSTNCSAEFTVTYQTANTVKFNPAIIGDPINTIHQWQFGDGSSSTMASPVHTYLSSGAFTATHVIKYYYNGAIVCTNTFTKIIQAQVACNLTAGFTKTQTSVNSFYFNNTSSPLSSTDSIRWTFGDGSSSGTVNATHTYTQPGTYLVCLRVQQRNAAGTVSSCVREICDTVIVQNPNTCDLVAGFTSSQTSINTVHFTNTSTGMSTTDSIKWSFGDGTYSNAVNPVHTYTQPGTYNVCLKIIKRNSTGTVANCMREICHIITVQGPPPCDMVANFTFTQTAPNTIQFTNTSTGMSTTDSIKWSFGDGTYSNTMNPSHTYTQPGSYNVCIRIVKANPTGTAPCVREKCLTIYVQGPPPCDLVANFSFTPVTTSPNSYHFTNTSTGMSATDSIKWTFGDGTYSNAVNPTHSYAQAGTYTVCLKIIKRNNTGTVANCVSEKCHTIVVQSPPPCDLVANFSFTSVTTSPNSYHFTNTSTGMSATDSIKWSFGDGTYSNAVNPTHSYAQAGTYTACLRIIKRNNVGTIANCVSEKCYTIVVTTACNVQANFNWRVDSSNHKKVYFNNLTISPTAAATAIWSFGDGSTASSWNAIHEYAQPGRYYVCLKVTFGPNCIVYKCDSVNVPPAPVDCNRLSEFSILRTAADNRLLHFVPNHINSNLQYTWTFGDGTGSQQTTTSHQYTAAGNYTACLTVYRGPNCASTTCKPVEIPVQINCNNVSLSYNVQRDPVIMNKYYFQAVSNFPIERQTWTVTKLNGTTTTPPVITNQNNPSYLFQDTGLYKVCLKAVTAGGCVKEFCKTIHVTQISTTNVCRLDVYPNPTGNTATIQIPLTQPELINIYIYNSLNVLVREYRQQGVAGNNTITLNIADLVAGNYNMKVIYGNQLCYAQFMKL